MATRPSENEAAISDNVALPIYKTTTSSTRLTCAAEANYVCHNSFDGQCIGTLILARLMAQRLTPCNYDMKEYAALSHERRFVARHEGHNRTLPLMTRSFSLAYMGGTRLPLARKGTACGAGAVVSGRGVQVHDDQIDPGTITTFWPTARNRTAWTAATGRRRAGLCAAMREPEPMVHTGAKPPGHRCRTLSHHTSGNIIELGSCTKGSQIAQAMVHLPRSTSQPVAHYSAAA
jgi:hypothetical protein